MYRLPAEAAAAACAMLALMAAKRESTFAMNDDMHEIEQEAENKMI